ncbi:Uncharacterized protein PCOAH_00005800 [Plasmodium coatneyi]|uniref:Uncharacterized protein n=1 Tax=Plasmodium coatneyi TaxID=208452 RepID=A0A1B1DTQ3_9APIC|nr:Uncharacterized protein PCOAH_00005800 [Plasmodium coatneyi]ANQ06124.1 Uncharacterized protein PCOAH_00005800 [Plasmodium coatneyi]
MPDARLPNELRNGEHSSIGGKSQMDLIVRKEIGKWVLLHRFIHKYDGPAGKRTLLRNKMSKQTDQPTDQPSDPGTCHPSVFDLFYHPTGTHQIRTGPCGVYVEECPSKVTVNGAIQNLPFQNNLSDEPKIKEDSNESLCGSSAGTKKVKGKATKKDGISKDPTEAIISKCIDIRSYIVKHKKSFKNILINLFNEYTFLRRYMNSNYNTYHKLKFFQSCNHYVKKLHDVLSIFADVVEESDEYLMIELYKKIKVNMRLLYYVGRILSNYLTCIAYKKIAYVIMVCISRVHTIFKCMLISEPFKRAVPELIKMIQYDMS